MSRNWVCLIEPAAARTKNEGRRDLGRHSLRRLMRGRVWSRDARRKLRRLVVCLNCATTEFAGPEAELRFLAKRDAAAEEQPGIESC